MKNMNMKKRYWNIDLQVFAEGEEPGGEESEDEDNPEDDDDEGDDPDDEKKFSQKDVDDAVKKRIAREKRKWQRTQQKNNAGSGKPDDKGKVGDGEEDEEKQELREKAAKADDLELKWTCLEHDVDKSCVDDVLALARVHMAKNDDMDIEDAIDAVLKKYPQFKESSKGNDEEEDETRGKSWGQRQSGRTPKKMSGVEKRFYELNPDLK